MVGRGYVPFSIDYKIIYEHFYFLLLLFESTIPSPYLENRDVHGSVQFWTQFPNPKSNRAG